MIFYFDTCCPSISPVSRVAESCISSRFISETILGFDTGTLSGCDPTLLYRYIIAFCEILNNSTTANKFDIIALAPYEIKGRTSPLGGSKPITTPRLNIASETILAVSPVAKYIPKALRAVCAIFGPRFETDVQTHDEPKSQKPNSLR